MKFKKLYPLITATNIEVYSRSGECLVDGMRLRVRGYNKAEQSWIYGSLLEDCFEDRYYILGDNQYNNMAGLCNVEKETISEYSGFRDEFGNPLYKGDKAILYTKLTGRIKVEEGFVNYSKKRGCWSSSCRTSMGIIKITCFTKSQEISTATIGRFTTT